MLNFEDLLAAFDWVSADPSGENAAYVHRVSGQVFWDSDDELPDDLDDGTLYLAVPHKHDLDLGKALVFDFVKEQIEDDYDKVDGIFKRPGAYGRFKDLLERKHLLSAWHEFEAKSVEAALVQWLTENAVLFEIRPATPAA